MVASATGDLGPFLPKGPEEGATLGDGERGVLGRAHLEQPVFPVVLIQAPLCVICDRRECGDHPTTQPEDPSRKRTHPGTLCWGRKPSLPSHPHHDPTTELL